MERNPALLELPPEDIILPTVDVVFPYENLTTSFEKAMNRYGLLDEEELQKAAMDANAKKTAKSDGDENQFLDLKFEELFNIPVTEGNAYNTKVSQYAKEGRVESSGSQLQIVSVNFDYDQIELSRMIISMPPLTPVLTTNTTTYVESPPTVTSNPQHGLPTTPTFDHASVQESLLNTQASIVIAGNLFTKGAFFGPSGGNSINAYFSIPVRPGSTENRTSQNVVVLNTAEGNQLSLYLASGDGHLIGDYQYEITHAVPHLLNNANYDVDQVGPNKILNEEFIYSLSNSYLETNIGALHFHIVDDVPLAPNQNGGTINEADIQTSGSSGSNVVATLMGGLIDPPTARFGADGGSVSNVTITGGATVFGFNMLTVTTAEGNSLVVDQLTGDYTFTLAYPVQNVNNQPSDQIFTYEFTDGDGSVATGKLTLSIADDIPIATDKTNTANETALFVNGTETATGNLLTDNNGAGISLLGADGGVISAVNGATDANDGLVDGIIHATTTYGDIVVYTTKQGIHLAGEYQYTLDSGKTSLENDNLLNIVDKISYVLTDNDGSQDSADLSVSITLNQAPTAVDDVGTTDEDAVLNVLTASGVLVNDTDPNNNDTKIVSAVNGVGANVGVQIALPSTALLQMNDDGSYSYDPNGAFNTLAQGAQTTDSFTYTMQDAEGLTSTATVTITINGVNTAPVAVDDTNSTNADTVINVNTVVDAHNLLINDTDDVGDTHFISEVEGVAANVGVQFALPSGALLTVNADGTYVYDPNGAFNTLALGSSTTDTFTYTLEDAGGLTSNATVTITINGVNDAPIANDDTNTTHGTTVLDVNTALDPHNLLVIASDIDVGDTLTVSQVEGFAANVGIQIALPSGALLTVNADGTYSYDPNGAFAATDTDSFTYEVSDNHGLASNVATVTINVIVPPIVLDLNDDGISLISPQESQVSFLLFGRDKPTTIGWVSGKDGLLAIDLNGDNTINGPEEFTFTHPNAKTDLEALRLLYDSNFDGILDMNDEDWLRFGVWQDANENGICEPGEFISLADKGIAAISLISDHQNSIVADNTLFGFSTYQTLDGQLHQLADVGLGIL
ncbi:MAG: Ig-like domain-containing protein [Candidatus Berkiella sp.]